MIAADLVPSWFAAGFWLAFAALVVVVIRDLRRAGGVRRTWEAVQEAIERRAQGDEPPESSAEPEQGEVSPDQADPRPDQDR